MGGNREFRRHCQDKEITNFYIRLSPISKQVDTKVNTHNIAGHNFLINLNVLVDYLKKLFQ